MNFWTLDTRDSLSNPNSDQTRIKHHVHEENIPGHLRNTLHNALVKRTKYQI